MDTSLEIGNRVQGQYVIQDILGKGEFGSAYLVRDKREGQRLFVLKSVSSPASKAPDRIPHEAVMLQRLRHPALPRIYHILQDDVSGHPYLLMDFIEGMSLETWQAKQPELCLSFSHVMTLLAPVMQALMYLHQQYPPIIHQHVKPSSIIIPTAGTGTALVGLSLIKKYDRDAITTTVRYGSPGYSAPEQYAGTRCIDPRTDVYGLGATLYTLLTDAVPAAALHRVAELREQRPDPLMPANEIAPAVSPLVAGIILRAMSVVSDDRFPSVEHLLDALWQVSTLPPQALQLSPFLVPAASAGETQLDAPAKMQWRAGPRSDNRAGEL